MSKPLFSFPFFAILCLFFSTSFAQTNSSDMVEAIAQREEMMKSSLIKDYPVRSIGPVVQGARIVDIAVSPEDKNTYYIAYASGGVFKTTNNGVSFHPIFDYQGALTIGDMAIAPSNQEIIYVGTGEKNSSRSTYAGSGMYKSLDGGKSWKHIGLDNSQHISRVLVHPENPEVVWVASIGALYSTNEERGVFKSTDGGATWKKTLYVNDSTGIIDLALNEQNPDVLLASSWERSRSAWNFKGYGPGSALYRSSDGGETWTKNLEGFPQSPDNGRIGMNFVQGNPNIAYVVMDNQFQSQEEKKAESEGLQIKDFVIMGKSEFLALEDKALDKFLKNNRYPGKYDSKKVKKEVREGKYEPKALAEYFGDANAALFDTKVTGAEVYRSDDQGKSWKKVNEYALDGVYYTYGYYFGEITVSPTNEDEIYIYGVPLLKSLDGGKSFTRIDTIGDVHVDHHVMWVDPEDDDHVLLGNDGGLYLSYDGGAEWLHLNNDAVGQFYTVNVDMEKPYNVYGGLQDNGTLMGSSRSVPNRTRSWEALMGGDGMFVAPDPRNHKLVYVGFQFGNYFKYDQNSGQRNRITPSHDIGEDRLRFNWRTPLILSQHNPDILYIGAQKIYKSVNQGKDWVAISVDLTRNKPQGNVPYSTITCIAESPHSFNQLYVGTDDSKLWATTNGGGSWADITSGLPSDLWVSSIFPSPHDEATVFVSYTGYRIDDFSTYVYRSDDFGKTWTSIAGNLPKEPVNVVIQDPVNPELLYLGTDHGTYISFDSGKSWEHLSEVPNVAAYDMMVHPRENELVIATHGRSMYVVDVKPFQQLKGGKINDPVILYSFSDIRHSERWGEKQFEYTDAYLPSRTISYFVSQPVDSITVEILNSKDEFVHRWKVDGAKGFHEASWNLLVYKEPFKKKVPKPSPPENRLIHQFIGKGKYKLRLTHPQGQDEAEFEVK